MATDRRESILQQLVAIAAATGATGLRNKINPSDQELPAIIIFDGDEEGDERDPENSRPVDSPQRIKMTPEIAIMAGDAAEAVGSTVNALRAKMIKAIKTDTTLLDFVTDRQGIRYLGCNTELARGRMMEGTMTLRFMFTYALRPAEF